MTSQLLRAVLVLEVTMVLWLLVAQAVYALADFRRRRAHAVVDRVRGVVLRAVVDGDASAGAAAISALAPLDRDALLCSIASSVRSQRDPLFAQIARAVGTSARIESDLTSRRWWVRRAALRRLTVLGSPSEQAKELLSDPAPQVRAVAAEWYALTAAPEEAAAGLVDMLGDPDARVRTRTMASLCTLGNATGPALAAGLSTDDRPQLLATLRVIRAASDGTTHRIVRSLLDHEDPEVKIEALRTVAPALTADDSDVLHNLIHHEDPRVRRCAIEAAGTAGLRDLVRPVARGLDDPDGAVREAAIVSLDHLGHGGRLLLDRVARVGGRCG